MKIAIKRVTGLLLLLAAALSLAACAGNKCASTEAGKEETEASSSQPAATEASSEETEPVGPAAPASLWDLVGTPLSEIPQETLQDILVQTALAYYYKNPYCQYNMTTNLTSRGVSGARLDTQGIDPEDITEDEPYLFSLPQLLLRRL